MMPRLALIAAACMAMTGCDALESVPVETRVVHGGDPARGRTILASGIHGCNACHAIPGIDAARGVVGPPLDGLAQRAFIAGQIPNKPAALVAFLADAPALVPGTGMPNVGLTAEEARDVAAYLYTLKAPHAR